MCLFANLRLDTRFGWATGIVMRRRRRALRETLVRIVQLANEGADAILRTRQPSRRSPWRGGHPDGAGP